MDADGSGETPLTHNTEVSDSQISATWSPDGDHIAYVRFVPDCARPCLGHYILYPSEIYRMNSDGSNPTLLKDFGKGSEVWGLDWQAAALGGGGESP
jgi:Tol biopolymer transport system component